MEKFNKLKELINGLEPEADNFFNKGNNAAGTRMRRTLQDIKDLAQQIRLEIQEIKSEDETSHGGPRRKE